MTYKTILITGFLITLLLSGFLSFDNLYFHETKDTHNDDSHDESIHILEAANEDTLNTTLQLQAARLLQSENKFDDAIIFYKRYERHTQVNADINSEIGLLLWTLSPNVESVKYFSKSLSLDSIHPGGLFGMGMATASIGESEKALLYFDKILKYHANSEFAKLAEQWKENLIKNSKTEE